MAKITKTNLEELIKSYFIVKATLENPIYAANRAAADGKVAEFFTQLEDFMQQLTSKTSAGLSVAEAIEQEFSKYKTDSGEFKPEFKTVQKVFKANNFSLETIKKVCDERFKDSPQIPSTDLIIGRTLRSGSSTLEANIANIFNQYSLADALSKLTELQARYDALATAGAGVDAAEVDKLKTELENALQRLDFADGLISDIQYQYDELVAKGADPAEVDRLKAELDNARDSVSEKRKEITNLKRKLTAEQKAHTATKDKLTAEQTEHAATKDKLTAEQTAHAATISELSLERAAHDLTKDDLTAERTAHIATKEDLKKTAKKSKIRAGFAIGNGIAATGLAVYVALKLLTGDPTPLGMNKIQADAAFVQYVEDEQKQLAEFQSALDSAKADGISDDEKAQLENQIAEFSKNDKEDDYSSTGEMRIRLSEAIRFTELQAAQDLYQNLLEEYEALMEQQPKDPYFYVEVLTQIVNVSDKFALSLQDNNLSEEERNLISEELDKLDVYEDTLIKELSGKFGLNITTVMDSIAYQVADFNTKIDELYNEIGIYKNEVQTHLGTIAEKDKAISNLEGKVAQLESRVAELESALRALANDNNSLKQELEVAKRDLETAKAEVTALRSENNSLKNQNAALETENSELVNNIAELESSVSSLNKEIADMNKIITTLKNQNIDLTEQRDELLETSAEYLKKIEEFEEKYKAAYADCVAKGQALEQLQAEYDKLYDEYEQALKTHKANVDELEAQVIALGNDLQAKADELQTAAAYIQDLEEELEAAKAKNSELTNQIAQNNPDFIRDLYTKLTGKSSQGKSLSEIVAYLSDAFDITISSGNSGALGDEGNAPQK